MKWYPVPNLDGYSVSKIGFIRGPKGRILKTTARGRVSISKQNISQSYLVAITFHDNPYKRGFVRHLDDDFTNFASNNLTWEPLTKKPFTDKNGETWVAMLSAPDYQVSDRGRVRRLRPSDKVKSGAIMKVRRDKDGYRECAVTGANRAVRIAREMLFAFDRHPKPGEICCHNNGVCDDDRLDNLRWGTYQSNSDDMVKHGTRLFGAAHPNSILTDKSVRAIRKAYDKGKSINGIAVRYQVSNWLISGIVKRERWQHVA